MRIQILGGGCPNCEKLAKNAAQAADELGIEYELEKVTDFSKIASMGVLKTPALAVDGTVLLAGRASTAEECKQVLDAVQ